ncbi:putative pectinesterase 52 [Humulus lupulus]|uniref:putative pectinesterase 52 n=1 Tax=Humulus lupulus TaxID=3486 RepID=UPI002B40FE1A|nr:putative pectinesterase 52 [Humulus lupulus]
MQLLPPLFINFALALFVLNIGYVVTSSKALSNTKYDQYRSLNVYFSKVKSSNEMKIITVDNHGSGDFNTIQAAIDSISPSNTQWIKIQISPGIYTEKVTIPPEKPYIYLEGINGRDHTVITFNDHGETDESATFSSHPDNIVAKGITFENSYNIMMSTGEVTPAVAARIYGDKSAFLDCGFRGVQDTLWDVTGRHYFSNCYIEGAVDFIFGYAQSYYEKTSINVTVGKMQNNNVEYIGYITAQGRASAEDSGGFVFEGGSISGSGQVYLGRAYGAFSRVIFHATNFASIIIPNGWSNFTYAEVHCEGPGSDTSKRAAWEKELSLSKFKSTYSKSVFINQDNWIEAIPQ